MVFCHCCLNLGQKTSNDTVVSVGREKNIWMVGPNAEQERMDAQSKKEASQGITLLNPRFTANCDDLSPTVLFEKTTGARRCP